MTHRRAPRPTPNAQRATRHVPGPTSKVPRWPSIAAIILVSLAASIVGFANDFAQDDLHLIDENLRVHSPLNLREMFTSPFWPPPFSPDLYRPLTSLWLSLQYAFGAGAPVVYRATSYVLYALVAAGVFVLAEKRLPRTVALGVALLFAAHPVHVEAVALGVGQSELLVGLIALAMVLLYLDRRASGSLRVRDWTLLAALYLAASLFKETGLVLPGLLAITELLLVKDEAGWSRRARVLWPGYAALAVVAAGVLVARRAVLGGTVSGTFTAEALQGLTGGGRLLTMLAVVPQWTRLLVWPAHLRADYSPQEFVASTHFGAAELLGLVIVLAAVVAVWRSWRRTPMISFGILWCAIGLLPVSNLIVPTGILLAERTLFLPSIGFVLAVGGMASLVWSSAHARAPETRRALAVACLALVAAGIARSAERQRVWRNDGFLAVRTVQDAPRSFRAQRAYGDLLFALGQRQLALAAYAQALALAPTGSAWRVRNDFARQFRMLGEQASEARQLIASLAERSDQDDDRGYLVADLLGMGEYAAAAAETDTAITRGGNASVFRRLHSVADSAARVGAPPGAIKIRINAGDVRADR